MSALRDSISHLRRTGDKHGNAPRFCPSEQYLPTPEADVISPSAGQVQDSAEARRVYRRLGMHYCHRCGGWHD